MTVKTILPWHKHLLSHFASLLAEKRLPHASLFRLRSGFSDEDLAWQLMQMILCDEKTAKDNCQHCHLMQDKSHPNILFLDVINDKIGIDDIRQCEQQIWQTALFDKPKVAYIQGVEQLSKEAQNALLKTLEEPPTNSLFILSFTQLSKLLPTLISRTQRLHHARVNQQLVLDWLYQQSNHQQSEEKIQHIAELAKFVPQQAKRLLNSDTAVQKLQREKAQFAEFIAAKRSAIQLAEGLPKTEFATLIEHYIQYTEGMISHLFTKTANKNKALDDKRADKLCLNSVQYETWNGVCLQALYRLHDVLTELRHLADSNINMHLQFTTSLTNWQNERKN